MATLDEMAQQRDFILFDDPAPSLASSQSQPLAAARSGRPYPLDPSSSQHNASSSSSSATQPFFANMAASFGKHRSPLQSPFIEDPTNLPETLDEAGSPQRKRQRAQLNGSSLPRSSREDTSGSSGSASVVSPKDPPSGSLGAPMHDLSLRDNMPAGQGPVSSAQASPSVTGMTPEQQERVKAQIRAELAGVDSRAFKGPLREILQKQDYTPKPTDMQTSPLSAGSDPLQAGVAPSFSLFPDYHLGSQSQASQSSQPNGKGRSSSSVSEPQEEEMPSFSQRSTESRTRSSTYDSNFAPTSYPPARNSQNILPDWARQSQSSQISRVDDGAGNSRQRRPYMPPPSQNLSQSNLGQRGGPVSMGSADLDRSSGRRPLKRESSGLTVSPQEAFLDYDDVENVLSHSGFGKAPSLFAPVPPGLSDAKVGRGQPGQFGSSGMGNNTPKATSRQTPRSHSSAEDLAFGPRPVPMSRNDTARPHHYQKRPGPSVYQGASDSRGSASQESGSQSSLFSPADSGDTISTDDDEDERPYYPPNMRPSMLRGGPSSLYLNYPAKINGHSSSSRSPSVTSQKSSTGKERTSSAGGAWAHVKNEPWAFRQAHINQPRFSDVSASSSDSEDDRGLGRHLHNKHAFHHHVHRPALPHHQSSSEDVDDTSDMRRKYLSADFKPSRPNMPGSLGGYGYIPGSQESGLSVAAASKSGKQEEGSTMGSQDEGSISPSIRSSAQVIERKARTPPRHVLPAATGSTHAPSQPAEKEVNAAVKNDKIEASGEEEDSEETSGTGQSPEEESEYDEGDGGSASSKKRRRSSPSTASGDAANGSKSKPAKPKSKPIAGSTGTTKCDYTSPITGKTCETAFHRPYDLARHRETIHAREEAGFIREGKLKLEDCVVLGKEVDPKKSMAVVEWKCKTCGASFSRKDAMLRHERLRHNAAK